jgi:adenine-specific DNA-methyltransferase
VPCSSVPVSTENCLRQSAHDARLIEYVDQLCEIQQRRLDAATPHEKAAYTRQAAAVDAQIDEAVYDLYELTIDERRAVEDSLEPLGG